jgi:putative addiction module killer protein
LAYTPAVRQFQTLSQRSTPKQIVIYADLKGFEPFQAWLDKLRDVKGRRLIIKRLLRVQEGNYGDTEPIGEGLSELRIFFGPGYRVYFGEDSEDIVLILCGGDKSTQVRDIANAKSYWEEYKSRAKS